MSDKKKAEDKGRKPRKTPVSIGGAVVSQSEIDDCNKRGREGQPDRTR